MTVSGYDGNPAATAASVDGYLYVVDRLKT